MIKDEFKLCNTEILISPYFSNRKAMIYKNNNIKKVNILYSNNIDYKKSNINKLIDLISNDFIDLFKPYKIKLIPDYTSNKDIYSKINKSDLLLSINFNIAYDQFYKEDILEYYNLFNIKNEVHDIDLFLLISKILFNIGDLLRFKRLINIYYNNDILKHDYDDYYSILSSNEQMNKKELYILLKTTEKISNAFMFMYKYLPKYLDKCKIDKYKYMTNYLEVIK